MPRRARVTIPGLPHHVTQRGNRRQPVFFQEEDRQTYLRLLKEETVRYGVQIWAYCLMDNHVHFIAIPARPESLAKVFGETHLRYTQRVNKREGWTGFLWQGRFSSFPLDERHLYAAIRYVERNPVEAGLVARAEEYPWSSARAHVGRVSDDSILTPHALQEEIKDWAAFLRSEDDQMREMLEEHTRSGLPFGEQSFLQELELRLGRPLQKGTPGRPRVNSVNRGHVPISTLSLPESYKLVCVPYLARRRSMELPEARTVEEVQKALAQAASETSAKERLNIVNLLKVALERQASDLHLAVGAPPMFRLDGSLARSEFPTLTREESKRLIYSLLTDSQKAQFERDLELDLSIAIKDLGRFRVNVHYQRGSVEAALRVVPLHIRSLEELGLPPVVAELTRRPSGLALITGPGGQGKTTTVAAMIELINTEREALIIVIEDPIEYVFKHKCSVVKQREVSADTHSVAEAMRRALRQDPDVIVVGDLRDVETIATALAAAETGHLVLATLPTPDALQTVNRLLDVFPPHQQQQMQIQLADCLQGVISQQLLPRTDGPGRVLAYEIMVATSAVRALIRDHATSQLPTVIQTGGQYGMTTMDATLKRLYQQGLITYETAVSRAKSPKDLAELKPTK